MNTIKTLSILDNDFIQSIRSYRIWNLLAFQDIRQRYRRSVIGPFWLTLSMLVSICAIGIVYSKIFKIDVNLYLPYLTIGFVLWSFISSVTLESCGVFTSSESIIKQVRLPFGIYVFRMVWRNLIILGHHIPVVIVVLWYFDVSFSWESIYLVPIALILTVSAGVFLGYLLGIICVRFRDVGQIINSVMQVVFYVTPVIWKADLLKERQWLLDFNPFYYYLEIMRFSIIPDESGLSPWLFSFLFTVFLGIVSHILMKKLSNKIAIWL